MYKEIKYKKSNIIKACDHMNEKMNSYETRVFGVFQFVAGIFGSLIFFVFVYTRHYLISIPFIFFILALTHPIFSKVLVDKEAITIKTNFYRKDVYFYEDIKKLEIKGRRLKIGEDSLTWLTQDCYLLFNPEKIKEGIKKYKPELLE